MNIGPGLSAEGDHIPSNKLQAIYSPNDEEFAIYTPTKILIYKLHTATTDYFTAHSSIPIYGGLRISLSYNDTILQSNSNYEQSTVIRLAWRPDREHKRIFALSLNTGQIVLREIATRLHPHTHPHINNTYSSNIAIRPGTSLVWNPKDTDLLAIGYSNKKMDQNLRIWDIQSNNQKSSVVFPSITIGNVISLAWIPDSSQTLVYTNNKGVGVYMYASSELPGPTNRSKFTYGLCVDSLSMQYFATHNSNSTKMCVWSIYNLETPVLRYDNKHVIEHMCWSRYKPACLFILTTRIELYVLNLPLPPKDALQLLEATNKDKTEEKYLDLQNHQSLRHMCSKIINLSSRTSTSRFSILPNPNSKRDSILLLHWSEDKDVTTPLQAGITLGQVDLPMHHSISISPEGTVAMATDLTLNTMQLSHEFQSPVLMLRHYIKAGYGFDVSRNREISSDNRALNNLWKWFERISEFVGDQRDKHMNILFEGLSHEIYREAELVSKSAINFVRKQDLNLSSEIVPRWKESPNRKLCLQLLRWLPLENSPDEFNKLLNSLTERGAVGEAVLACFCNDPVSSRTIQQAIDLVQKSDSVDKGVAVMSLAGYPNMCDNHIWLDTCLRQTEDLTDPHLRLAIKVLYSDYERLVKSIKEEQLSHTAKFAMACTYLKDSDLGEFVSEEIEAIKDASDIEGLFIYGLNKRGFSMMSNYINKTNDLLTVTIVATLCIKYYMEAGKLIPNELNELANAWWSALSNLLDQLCLWKERCQLNIVRNKILKSSNRPAPLNPNDKDIQDKWDLLCPFCSKSISDLTNQEYIQIKRSRGPNRIGGGSSIKVTSPGTCCPNCNKPLPRCVICQRHMGSPSCQPPSEVASPVDNWITWCQSCGHWGHTVHLSDWFSENTRCAAPNCGCACYTMDDLVIKNELT